MYDYILTKKYKYFFVRFRFNGEREDCSYPIVLFTKPFGSRGDITFD